MKKFEKFENNLFFPQSIFKYKFNINSKGV